MIQGVRGRVAAHAHLFRVAQARKRLPVQRVDGIVQLLDDRRITRRHVGVQREHQHGLEDREVRVHGSEGYGHEASAAWLLISPHGAGQAEDVDAVACLVAVGVR